MPAEYMERTCTECNGAGVVYGETCPTCGGYGYIEEEIEDDREEIDRYH